MTAYYNSLLNDICERHPERYQRRAVGKVHLNFKPDVAKSFNRGFTHYFFDGRDAAKRMSSPDTPKSIGEPLGKVKSVRGNSIIVDTKKDVANGDGIIFFNHKGSLSGFRANSVSGKAITPFEKVTVAPGTMLYRNFDKVFNDTLVDGKSAVRSIDVAIRCWKVDGGIATEITDERGTNAVVRHDIDLQPAKSDQQEARLKVFSKLGSTPYHLRSLILGDTADVFIPASTLTTIRRDAVEALVRATKLRHHYDFRRQENKDATYTSATLTYADNVANHLARQFYADHGVKHIEEAMETCNNPKTGDILMTTRFCLRREYGRCLRTPEGQKWQSDLMLTSGNISMSVEFDCRNCQMLLRHM